MDYAAAQVCTFKVIIVCRYMYFFFFFCDLGKCINFCVYTFLICMQIWYIVDNFFNIL